MGSGGRPYTTNSGKNPRVRVQRADKPGVTEIRMWGAYEKVSVKRTISKEWNRIEERP